ncbi:unnamed protein product, partial [Symbiodinium sp. CCMP2592]
VSSAIEAATAVSGRKERRRSSKPSVAVTLTRAQAHEAPMWTLPSVLHPFLARWHHFSVCDKICTPEFVAALRLVDQDLLCLCRCQGVGPKETTPTLQLLAMLLNSEHLGCVSPPAKPSGPQAQQAGSAARTS